MDAYQGSVYDPVSLHKYLYANANPVMYSDPSGYMGESELYISLDRMSQPLLTIDEAQEYQRRLASSSNNEIAYNQQVLAIGLEIIETLMLVALNYALTDLLTPLVGPELAYLIATGITTALDLALDVLKTNINKSTNSRSNGSDDDNDNGFNNWLNDGDSVYSVYFGMDKTTGELAYTGMTKQSLNDRLYQHNNNPNLNLKKNFMDLIEIKANLTNHQAHAIEQFFISKHENGPNAQNKINSISPKRKVYDKALNWAAGYLAVNPITIDLTKVQIQHKKWG
jgi:hypothetical protein